MGKGKKTPKGKKAVSVKDMPPKAGQQVKGGAEPEHGRRLR